MVTKIGFTVTVVAGKATAVSDSPVVPGGDAERLVAEILESSGFSDSLSTPVRSHWGPHPGGVLWFRDPSQRAARLREAVRRRPGGRGADGRG